LYIQPSHFASFNNHTSHFLVYPVKLPHKHHSILNTENGKAFETGYKEEAMNIKVKSVLAGIAFRQVANYIKGLGSAPIG